MLKITDEVGAKNTVQLGKLAAVGRLYSFSFIHATENLQFLQFPPGSMLG
jgi:hypothetical protein